MALGLQTDKIILFVVDIWGVGNLTLKMWLKLINLPLFQWRLQTWSRCWDDEDFRMEGASTAPSFASSEVISNWHWLLAILIFHVLIITDGVTVHKIHGSVQFTVLWLWFLVQFGIRWSLGKSNSLCLVKLKEWGSVKSDPSLWQSEVKKRWDSGTARKKTLPNKWKACWN